MNKDKIKHALENIISTCKDTVEGYETAAGEIEDDSIKTLFLRLAQQRKAFIEDLKNEALKLGIEPEDNTTVKGFFQRTWLAAKHSIGKNTKEKTINEAMDGEKKALETYAGAQGDMNIPEYIQETLKEQEHLIKVAIHQLNGLLSE
jgi:uncharacterized protein (TIGR02284 family)